MDPHVQPHRKINAERIKFSWARRDGNSFEVGGADEQFKEHLIVFTLGRADLQFVNGICIT